MPKKTIQHDLDSKINVFLKELPDATRSPQSVYQKELSVNDKKIILIAQQIKGSNGMTWNVNVC